MKKITLGGERLGAGKRMKVGITGYGRSNNNLNEIFRSTMSCGTLVPAYTNLFTPGTSLDMDIRAKIQTNPTVGSLYGTYIFGVDVFQIPLRLYIGGLQYNAMNLAVNMQNIKMPMIEISTQNFREATDNSQVGSSCVLKYLGIKGIGSLQGYSTAYVTRQFPAIPAIGYYDIFYNYYSNKQETNCYMVHTDAVDNSATITAVTMDGSTVLTKDQASNTGPININTDASITFTGNLNIDTISIAWQEQDPTTGDGIGPIQITPIRYLYTTTGVNTNSPILLQTSLNNMYVLYYIYNPIQQQQKPNLQAFPLQDIVEIRPVLNSVPVGSQLVIDNANLYAPWKYLLDRSTDGNTSLLNSQEGLMVKTYQSDILQNFIKTATVTSLNAQTAISTAGANFTIDTLNFAIKLNNLLQREAAAAGTLQDYISVAYGVEMYTMTQIPMYMGGMRDNIVFDEVVSNAATPDEPLGQIAGKGRFQGDKKGGHVSIRINEWSFVMAIAHITPNVDYSQGNAWYNAIETMDDIHKPALDEIGYQDGITEWQAYWDTIVDLTGVHQKSFGKQPAWMWYTTSINKTYGLFAEEDNMMFMTLNRRWEKDEAADTIKDLTTYIDPVKFNYIFAQTELSAQNFRVQIAFDVNARIVKSAREIPNL